MLDNSYRIPREIDEREVVFDARPKTAQEAADDLIRDMKEMPQGPAWINDDGPAEPPPPPVDRLGDRLRTLAVELGDLSYLTMLRLAREVLGEGEAQESVFRLANMLALWAERKLQS